MIKVKTPVVPFRILYQLPGGTTLVICIGGRGGAKTYEISKFIAMQSTVKAKRCVILRDEKSLIRESILNEVLLRYDTANATGVLDMVYQKMDSGIKNRATGEMMVFTKGFRASAKEKKANLKSISNIDIAVIEEAEDIRDEDQFNTFTDSIRNEGALIILVLNTPDINHFIVKRYFNLTKVADEEGFFEITPKEMPGFVCIKTSYKDNPFLPKHIVSKYEGYGDPSNNFYNKFYYLTAIMGYASTGRKGQVLTKVKPMKLEEYLKLPFKEIYGLDFGTSSPAGIIGCKLDKNNLYARQINYLPLNVLDIGKIFCQLALDDGDVIVADSAEPQKINKLRTGWPAEELTEDDILHYPQLLKGFNIYGAAKPEGSIQYGITLLDGMSVHVCEESTDFWNEIYSYIYAQDKNGNYTNDPIDDFNHLIDPLRYVATSRGRLF